MSDDACKAAICTNKAARELKDILETVLGDQKRVVDVLESDFIPADDMIKITARSEVVIKYVEGIKKELSQMPQ